MSGDQTEVFKLLNGNKYCFSVEEEKRTRGHEVTLTKKKCRLDMRKVSFSQRTVNEWLSK